MSLHVKRTEALILKELSTILNSAINDPKLGFVTVSEVRLTNDLSYAKVYVSFLGQKARNEAGLKTLQRAKGHIRSELAKRLNIRKMPDLIFVMDESLKNAQKINDIIEKINHEG